MANLHSTLRKLGPGVYEDGDGGLHIMAEEAMDHLGLPHTDASMVKIINAARALADEAEIPLAVIDHSAEHVS